MLVNRHHARYLIDLGQVAEGKSAEQLAPLKDHLDAFLNTLGGAATQRHVAPSRSRCSASRRTTARGRRSAGPIQRPASPLTRDQPAAARPRWCCCSRRWTTIPTATRTAIASPTRRHGRRALGRPASGPPPLGHRRDPALDRPPRLATPDLSARADAGAGARRTLALAASGNPGRGRLSSRARGRRSEPKDPARRRHHRRYQRWWCAAVRPRARARQSPHPARRPHGREGRDTMSRFLWISLGTLAATSGAIAGASYVHRRRLAADAGDESCRPAGRRGKPRHADPRAQAELAHPARVGRRRTAADRRDVKGDLTRNWGRTPLDLRPQLVGGGGQQHPRRRAHPGNHRLP
jgi:hypothetical protein